MGGKCCTRLSAVAFGVSLGLVTGIIMMVFAWIAMHGQYGTAMITQWSSLYPGYEATVAGGFIGLAWGFLEGFIIGLVWGWLYNLCLCCCRCACCKKPETMSSTM